MHYRVKFDRVGDIWELPINVALHKGYWLVNSGSFELNYVGQIYKRLSISAGYEVGDRSVRHLHFTCTAMPPEGHPEIYIHLEY